MAFGAGWDDIRVERRGSTVAVSAAALRAIDSGGTGLRRVGRIAKYIQTPRRVYAFRHDGVFRVLRTDHMSLPYVLTAYFATVELHSIEAMLFYFIPLILLTISHR